MNTIPLEYFSSFPKRFPIWYWITRVRAASKTRNDDNCPKYKKKDIKKESIKHTIKYSAHTKISKDVKTSMMDFHCYKWLVARTRLYCSTSGKKKMMKSMTDTLGLRIVSDMHPSYDYTVLQQLEGLHMLVLEDRKAEPEHEFEK